MSRMLIILILFCGLLSFSPAQAQQDKLNEYLNAMVSKNVASSKKVLERTSFNLDNDYVINSFTEPSGTYFETDLPGIRGYKATVWCDVTDGQGFQTTDTFLVVMYYDLQSSHWKVFDFRQNADVCYEAQVSQNDVDSGVFYTDKEYVYRNLGYWQMMCGNISRAEKAYQLAAEEAALKGIDDFVKEDLEAIEKIK